MSNTDKTIGIIIIHGIGEQTAGYSLDLQENITQEYFKLCGKNNLVYKEVLWQPIIEPREDLDANSYPKDKLNYLAIRDFGVKYIGDLIAYEPEVGSTSVYTRIHKLVDQAVLELIRDLGKNAPICIVAHSLGCIITRNYLIDLQNPNSIGRKVFIPSPRTENVMISYLCTTGNPLYLYSLTDVEDSMPVVKLWDNIHSPNDVIAYPIKTINDQYRNCETIKDISMKVGGLLTKWNPACHTYYFSSSKVVSVIANRLKELNN